MSTLSPSARDRAIQRMPDIVQFRDRPTDRFLVDLSAVSTGHPYKGRRADRPHTGGHVYFRRLRDQPSSTEVGRFPPIYAVAAGVVTRVDYSFRLRPVRVSDAKGVVANTRYGIGLMFAQSEGHPVELHYSIEPFVDPGDDRFYEPFILVRPGQRVRKGDVIARMYLPPDRDVASKSHIHFNLLGGPKHEFQSPSIFDRQTVVRFHALWGNRGTDGGRVIPPCMGYRVDARENPFERRAADVL